MTASFKGEYKDSSTANNIKGTKKQQHKYSTKQKLTSGYKFLLFYYLKKNFSLRQKFSLTSP